jgi:hypothetical protein
MSLSALLAVFLAAGQPVILPDVRTPSQKQIIQNQKNTKGASTRLTPSNRFKRYLTPVTKQKFKQNRRNELTKSRKKKNKQF